jgi:diphthine synthase
MTLYLIGIGLSDEKDISLKGLEAVKKCSKIYLESYTSILQTDISKLEELYGKKIILADRDLVEKNSDEILSSEDVAFLVIGDALSATTHVDLMQRAKEKGINVEIIHNASVLNAVSVTGLQLYKFGKTTSIPFHDAATPCKIIKENQSIGAHTLCLLDLDPINKKFLTIPEGIDKIQEAITEETLLVGCARLGSKDFVVKGGTAKELKEFDFGSAPYCLIVPSSLHFMEEEILKKFSN